MSENKIEKEGTYKGFDYKCVTVPLGHRTGYVRLPEGHKYFKKSYDDISVECHGGLTFGQLIDKDIKPGIFPLDTYWIGFDCAHAGDARDNSIMSDEYKKYWAESKFFQPNEFSSIKTLEFVEEECKKIIDQLC